MIKPLCERCNHRVPARIVTLTSWSGLAWEFRWCDYCVTDTGLAPEKCRPLAPEPKAAPWDPALSAPMLVAGS